MIGIDLLPVIGKDRWTITPLWSSEDRLAFEHSLFRLLSLANREKLDALELVELFEAEHWGFNRSRLRKVADQLREDRPISQTLINCGLSPQNHVTVCLRIGESSGELDSAWKEILDWCRPMNLEATKLWRSQSFYWTIVGAFSVVVATVMLLTTSRMVQEMSSGLELGPMLANRDVAIAVAVGIANMLLIALVLYWSARSLRWLLSGTIQAKEQLGRVAWSTRRNEVLRQFALCRSIKMEERQSFETILRCNPNPKLQRVLRSVIVGLERGESVGQQLHQSRLLRKSEALALSKCETVDVQAWILRYLTLNEREKSLFKRFAYGVWVQPCIAIAMGVFVLLTGYLLLGWLSHVTRSLAQAHG
jgi:type II secretory pathway component PulF